jgi:protein O-GlcNAc transferase
MIVRDTDSRISEREIYAVEEWMASGKGFHIMRDHPWHKFPILGGMWGIRKGVIPNLKELINSFNVQNSYGTDYQFLAAKVLPLVQNNMMVHDEFYDGKPFPTQRSRLEFVGKVYDSQENTVTEHEDALREYLLSKKK